MADVTPGAGECLACRANGGEVQPPGGVIYDDGFWRVEHMLAPAVLPGWLIVKPLRHVESLSELTPLEAGALGPLLVRVTAALEAVTGAARVYACLYAEVVRHVHFHLIPRGAALPDAARGAAIFALPAEAAAGACATVARRVADRLRDHHEVTV